MAEPLFELIFLGADLNQNSRAKAVEALRILLGSDPSKAEEILTSRQGVVLRSGLNDAEARKLQTALVKLGVRCNYRPCTAQSLKLEIVPIEHEENPSAVVCPECHARTTPQPGQPRPEVCPECGLVFSKHEQSLKELEERAAIRRKLLLAQQTMEQELADQTAKEAEKTRRLELEAEIRKQLGIPAVLGSRPRLIGSAAVLFLFGIGSGFFGAHLLSSTGFQPDPGTSSGVAESPTPQSNQLGTLSEQDLKLAAAIAKGKPNLQLLDLVESIVTYQGSADQPASATGSKAPPVSGNAARRIGPEPAIRSVSGLPIGATLTEGLPALETLRAMVSSSLAQSHPRAASALLNEMQLRVETVAPGAPRLKAQVWVAGLLVQSGEVQAGKQLFAQAAQSATRLPSPEERAIVSAEIGAELTRVGEAAEGLRSLQTANREFSGITDLKTKLSVSCDLAEAYARAGRRGTALDLLDSVATGSPKITNGVARDHVLQRLALANARVLDPAGVVAAIATIASDAQREQALFAAAREFVRAGHTLWASDLTARFDQPYPKARALALLAEAYANSPGTAANADKAFAEADSAARAVVAPSQKVLALADLGRALAGAGRVQRSEEAFDSALQLARSLEAPQKAEALAAIVDAHVDDLNPKRAAETVSEIADPALHARLSTRIEGATRISRAIRDSQP